MNALTSKRWARARPRYFITIAVVITLLSTYIGSYIYLSRRGMREAATYSLKGFLYIPVKEATSEQEMGRHYDRATFYAPANAVDQILTGAEKPVICILFGLSSQPK
jgi:hypothetical protein